MAHVTTYHDTRGRDITRPAFSDVIVAGIAPGGGLYVPDELPSLALDDILALEALPYWRRAADLFVRFGVDVGADRIAELMRAAYGEQWSDPRIAPLTEVVAGTHVLELWHGPTSAFKDMALQCMPLFFSESVRAKQAAGMLREDFLVLVATSGDTGKAALEGFADRPHTNIVVFYPAEGVSDLQRRQMVTQAGDNVGVFAVRGNFDDCQNAVKAAFADSAFASELRERHGLLLSSANSINWGRLLPQISYYVSAYADLVGSGGVVPGKPMDVCVPTGNFGNILGAYYAKQLGVPIGRLICASNENKVLADFIATGLYDVSGREFVITPSPSMDILISSNLERQLYELTRDPERTTRWMAALHTEGRFTVDRETFARVREHFAADSVTNDESLATIKRVWHEHRYLLDPHTAVAWEVAERLRDQNPVVVVSTAHWAKFGTDVYKALLGIPYSSPLPDDVASLSGVEMLAEVQRLTPGSSCVPTALANLDDAIERFSEVVDGGREGVEDGIDRWLTRR
ncbi:MAG: threonine synthase [Coriobacteriia bacterium]|jgi:threonine synthase|nr:threonine synthase [Coriobacteriia bacterium]